MAEPSAADLTDHLPLQLIKSETIPPSPNLSESGSSAVDWLPDFAGYSWIAYGASSLLVISHFPSPLSPQQSRIGPVFRQVFELLPSSDFPDVVSVAWSPAIPSSGDLAAAADNHVFLFHYDSSPGSFCWSQTATLVQSAKAEAVAWTGSGDGIIAAGKEVVLWKRNIKSWEIAWKFRMKVPQTLVSATWSLDGLSATGAYPTNHHADGLVNVPCNESGCVSVFQYDRKAGYVAAELRHPQPVLAIQWRPCGGRQLNGDFLYATRHVLLTSSVDGTVRLWCEIDDSRMRKGSKDNRETSNLRRSFCVVTSIEINQSLGGTLGKDIFLEWALEIDGMVCGGDGLNKNFTGERCQSDEVGSCEWLIGIGPGQMLTFWAVHCLDDIATMQSPRVTLWKKQEVSEPGMRSSCRNIGPRCYRESYLNKVSIKRNRFFGPPAICSLLQLFPCNSFIWSVLYDQSLQKVEEKSSLVRETDKLSCQSVRILDTLGHTGKILQVAVHPCTNEVELAVSLDSNGLLMFWSISNNSYSLSGLPTFTPSWKIVGNLVLQYTISQNMSLYWAPSWLEEDQILLIGHAQGIDCLIIKTCVTEEDNILCHKLCTIPFAVRDHLDGPDKIVSVPLHSTREENIKFNNFFLMGVWMKSCEIQSWKLTLHSYEHCERVHLYNSDTGYNADCSICMYKTDFAGKTYFMAVSPCSSDLSDVHNDITSISVVSPSLSMHYLQNKLVNDSCLNNFPFHMATGHSDGRSRLWRINLSDLSVGQTPFELVGIISSLQSPVTAIAVADWGQKIATICSDGHRNNVNMLYIWEPLHLTGAGTLELEDKICLNGKIVAFTWFQIENILFLGVCFQNELHIYSRRVCSVQISHDLEKLPESSSWVCIAIVRTSPTICDFVIGPRGTLVVIHENYFTLFSHWSLYKGNKHSTDYSVGKIQVFEELSFEKSSERDSFCPPLTKAHDDVRSLLIGDGTEPNIIPLNKNCFLKMTVVAEKLAGPLPFYHPEALLTNIYSGNWRRAYVAVCHLFECLTSNSAIGQGVSPPKSSIIITQINLSKYFEGQSLKVGASQGLQWSNNFDTNNCSRNSDEGLMHFADTSAGDAMNCVPAASATSSESYGFHKILEKLHGHHDLTGSQKMQMLAIIELLNEISNSQSTSAYGSLDDTGRRFWCGIRLQQLDYRRRYHKTPSIEELVVDSRVMVWAFHSDCQAILFSTILPTEPTWEDMRKLGVGFWFTNLSDLRSKMEKLARSRYLKNKDPKACALLYIALNRLQVLTGLFKISKDEKDKPLVAFLSRNFQEERHRAAALKNAYVLMGRHQYELAIAFFLLGGDTISAITVCAKTLGDEQLALVICRLIEGQGGASERHLILKILLPSAIEKGDYWLASILEWVLGNYLQSFLIVLGLQGDSYATEFENSFRSAAFLDPSIGQYCQMLTAKNVLKNAVGEQNIAILCRWTIVMTASGFNKRGLPLEALECLSSSASILGIPDKRSKGEDSEILPRILLPSPADSFRWLSHEVACHLVYQVKLDLAMQYAAKLFKEHPCWLTTSSVLSNSSTFNASSLGHEISQYGALLGNFEQLLDSEFAYLEQKFSVARDVLLDKIFVSLDSDKLLLYGCKGFASHVHLPPTNHNDCTSSWLIKHFVDVTERLSYSLPRFINACSIASSRVLSSSEQNLSDVKPYCFFQLLEFYMQGFILSISNLEAALMKHCSGSSGNFAGQCIIALDLCKYCIYFTSAMLQRNLKALDAMLRPVLVSCTDGIYEEIDIVSLRTILGQVVEALSLEPSGLNGSLGTQGLQQENGGNTLFIIPEDEIWIILKSCLWQHLSKFIECQLNFLFSKLSYDDAPKTSVLDSSLSLHPDSNCSLKQVRQVLMIFIETMGNTFTHIPPHTARQLAIFLQQKVQSGTSLPILTWLEESNQSTSNVLREHQDGSSGFSETSDKDNLCSSSKLLTICNCPKTVSEMLAQLPVKLSELIHWKPGKGWNHLHMGVLGEHEKLESYKQEGIFDSSPRGNRSKSPSAGSEQSNDVLDSDRKGEAVTKKVVPFNSPKEIYRRNGELLEAFCISSIEQQQAALARNKKGICFFSWGDVLPFRDPSDYIWAQADWPQNGWAGTDSTPVPTCVSPGAGPGSDSGSPLGLGVATNGFGSQARLGNDLTGGGAFGIPGYAGIGATGMGWGIQEEFDHCVDPPATLNNVNGSALAAHPSRPFFLVGSSNTHIYLWEFGEEKAAATYGIIAAANIPPPYALPSVTSLQFDHCGHRFASSASDGTVSAWQLEVGGGAMDVCYVATSGSVIAASGYSSNGVNVVIWDTLAPPSSSRASVMCHEGGASSIAVFDNDVGTGSISPLIVTGGKGGDVGLHDFRYIATGKTKRQRHLNSAERSDTAAIDIRSEHSSSVGDQNRHGMLWYIPKAHSGSISKIATIPNTSFFLTGSKDGDVKLWDAKRASLVFHWPRLHERHTFLQRSSQSFGGVTRVGVTDIQVISDGFLTCGGDGSVKLIQLDNNVLL
uniref:RAVE complex protein Rav1 C-terminal domain-containing protein n=1 Tax=Chenopodium quinoa TaxID=63459 RepID=A0A803KZQ1_CHEQI